MKFFWVVLVLIFENKQTFGRGVICCTHSFACSLTHLYPSSWRSHGVAHEDNSGEVHNSDVMLCYCDHFGSFWCTSCATLQPLHDLFWLLSLFKCPFTPEMDHISHSGQICNTLLSHGTVTILVHFGAFNAILVHLMCNPMTLPWLALTPIPFQMSIYSRNGSY